MQTINIITKEDVRQMVEECVAKRMEVLAKEVFNALEDRMPEPGPTVLSDNDSVDLLSLSNRAMRILEDLDIRTIGQLASRRKSEVWKWRGCGHAMILEIETRLARFGRKFAA